MDDNALVVIEAENCNLTSLVRELQPLCDLGYVCDLTLQDGVEVSAVLVGVSSTALILDRWDNLRQRPAGDPFVIELGTVRRVVIP